MDKNVYRIYMFDVLEILVQLIKFDPIKCIIKCLFSKQKMRRCETIVIKLCGRAENI